MKVSRKVSSQVSSEVSLNGTPPQPDPARPPGRYLVRTGCVYLFQIKMPEDIGGRPARVVRLGLGALSARQARARADLLAALVRSRFDEIRIARLARQEEAGGESDAGEPLFDGGSPEITAAEVKGYLKGMLSILAQPAPPTPPHQETAFAGLRGLVALGRELAKGAGANPLIADNAELLRQQSIERIARAPEAAPATNGTPPRTSATQVAETAGASSGHISTDAATGSRPMAEIASTSPDVSPARTVEIHRDADGKLIPAFKLDRRTAPRKPSDLPLFSEVAQEYFEARAVKVGEKNKDIRTARYRLGVFIDLIGDHPVDTYTGADLQAYVALMTHWPADKRHRPDAMTPREILASNAEMKFKPLKRSALEDGYVTIVKTIVRSKMTEWEYPDPFSGVKLRYPDTAAPRESAEPLSSEKIGAIFRKGVEGGLLDEAMLPLLGHLTGRRLGLLVHLTGNDIREKYPGVWVAQTSGITLGEDGIWRRVPIKSDASVTFFVLHDFLRQIGFIDWATRQGDAFLFRELTRLSDPSKSASSYMGRLFRKAGVEGGRKEVFHSLRGGSIEQMRDNRVDTRDRKLQAGHALDDEHDLYGFRAISEKRANGMARAELAEGVDFSVFEGLDFDRLARGKRTFGRRRKG